MSSALPMNSLVVMRTGVDLGVNDDWGTRMADEPNNTDGASGQAPEQGSTGGAVPSTGGSTGWDARPVDDASSTSFDGSSPDLSEPSSYGSSSSPYGNSSAYGGSNSSYEGSGSEYSGPAPYGGSNSYGLPSDSGDAQAPATGGSTSDAQDSPYGESNDQVTNLSEPTSPPAVNFGKDLQANDAPNGPSAPYGSSTDPYGSNAAASPYEQPSPYGQAPQPAQSAPYGQDQSAPYGQSPQAQQPAGPQYGGTPPYGGGVNPYSGAGYPGAQNKFNIFGLLALIIGGLALLFGLIPFVGMVAVIFAIGGVTLGILGLVLKNFNAKKGLAIAGSIVSVIALIVAIANPFVWGAIISSSASQTLSDYDTADKQVEIVLTVTADAPVDIDYNIDNGLSDTDAYDKSEALFGQTSPWTTTVTVGLNTKYDYSGVDLNANAAEYDDNVSCEVKVDGIIIAQDSGTGYASCYVSGINSYLS